MVTLARRRPDAAVRKPSGSWRAATARGIAHVTTRAGIVDQPVWRTGFAHLRKDSRYYEIVDRSLRPGFDYRYLVLEDHRGRVRAILPFFILDQDVLAGSGSSVRAVAARLRRFFPRLLTVRTLMVGCAAGEGHLPSLSAEEQRWAADSLQAVLKRYAKHARAGMIVLKDFPAAYRETLRGFADKDYVRIPSMPATRLNIEYGSFEAYLREAVSKATRKDLRRKFRHAAAAEPITFEVVTDLSPYVDEIYPLYLQVYERSPLKFEKLTKEYLSEIGQKMPDKVRCFLWRQQDRMVAFSICMLQDDQLWDEYIGLDYSVALKLHLYFYTFRDTVQWAMTHGYKWYCSSALNYEPKARLGSELMPLDLYVSHTSRIVNVALRFILPWLEPTRNDAALRKFANYSELRG